MYHGGPAASDPASHFEVVEAERAGDVRIFPATNDPEGRNRKIRVVCAAIGEQQLHLRVGNTASASNPKPIQESIEISFVCAEPAAASFWVSHPASVTERKACLVFREVAISFV